MSSPLSLPCCAYRGGSWRFYVWYACAAYRNAYDLSLRVDSLSLRLLRRTP